MTRRLRVTESITAHQKVFGKRGPHISKSMPATVVTLVRRPGVRKDPKAHYGRWTGTQPWEANACHAQPDADKE